MKCFSSSRLPALLVASFLAGPAQAEYLVSPIPRTLSYRGHLERDGGPVTADALAMTFALYTDAAACASGSATPDWEDILSVAVYAGRFSAVLGSDPANPIPDALFRGGELHLGIAVEGSLLGGCQAVVPTGFAQRSGGDVPLGAVIDWWRPNGTVDVPAGYQICNGSEITDPRSPLVGAFTPDLVGKLVRGVANATEIGQSGGSDDLPPYTVPVDQPPYAVSWQTAVDGTHNHRWSFLTDAENWYTYDSAGDAMSSPIINWDDGLDSGGSGIYPFAHDGGVSSTQYYYTRSEGSHDHAINATLDLPTFDATCMPEGGSGAGLNVPAYIGLLKLVRIY